MPTFSAWRPGILVEYGDQQLSAALHMLASYGPELDRSRRNQARSLVDYANDIKHTLNTKHFLARIKPARLYARKASEALEIIKAMPVLGAIPPDCPRHSQQTDSWMMPNGDGAR